MRKSLAGIGIGAALAFMTIAALSVAPTIRPAQAAGVASTASPADALKLLMEGNQRFTEGKMDHPRQGAAQRVSVAGGQHPFACILSCSDSRIPPETIFDQGLGDVFVLRVAGNVPEPAGMESLRYAVDSLGPRLILVLGHRQCGAVNAAVTGNTADFPVIDAGILPAVVEARKMPGDLMENATLQNVRAGVQRLSRWRPFAAMVKSGQLKIVGGIYDLHTGKVFLLDQPGAPANPPLEEGAAD
jgi:carbonic anhydrase